MNDRPTRRRFLRPSRVISLLVLVFLAAFFGLWVYDEFRYAEAVAPPPGVNTFADFLDSDMPVDRIHRVQVNGKPWLHVIGNPPERRLALPSGYPAWVFDASGNLVDWTADNGDGGPFVDKWGQQPRGTVITEQEARAWIESDNAN